jgi:WD40 repeat protein
VFCLDISADSVATGSADHGLRIFDLNTGKYRRELFSKQYGHKEWVATCAYTKDGRLVSGGMDNQICVWAKNAVRCDTLSGHKASISKVMVDEHNICVSSSYDCVMNVWDLDRLDTGIQLKGAHKNAVLQFDWRNSLVVSGDKDGVVAMWVSGS